MWPREQVSGFPDSDDSLTTLSFFFFGSEFLEVIKAVSDLTEAEDRRESIFRGEYNLAKGIDSKLMSRGWTKGEY